MTTFRATRTRGGERVEHYRGRIGARFLLDQFQVGAARPHFELLDRRGAKGVGGRENYASTFFFQATGELADRGGFAGPIHANDKKDPRFVGRFSVGICSDFRCCKNFQDLIFQLALQRCRLC